jgi:hypothetical protein
MLDLNPPAEIAWALGTVLSRTAEKETTGVVSTRQVASDIRARLNEKSVA